MKRPVVRETHKMADKSDATEVKHPFKLYLRIRPQKNGNTQLIPCYAPKDNKSFHVIVPEDSVVAIFKLE